MCRVCCLRYGYYGTRVLMTSAISAHLMMADVDVLKTAVVTIYHPEGTLTQQTRDVRPTMVSCCFSCWASVITTLFITLGPFSFNHVDPHDALKHHFTSLKKTLNFPTTKDFRMRISMKLVDHYMVIFFILSPTSNHFHPLQVTEMTMVNSGF